MVSGWQCWEGQGVGKNTHASNSCTAVPEDPTRDAAAAYLHKLLHLLHVSYPINLCVCSITRVGKGPDGRMHSRRLCSQHSLQGMRCRITAHPTASTQSSKPANFHAIETSAGLLSRLSKAEYLLGIRDGVAISAQVSLISLDRRLNHCRAQRGNDARHRCVIVRHPMNTVGCVTSSIASVLP